MQPPVAVEAGGSLAWWLPCRPSACLLPAVLATAAPVLSSAGPPPAAGRSTIGMEPASAASKRRKVSGLWPAGQSVNTWLERGGGMKR